MRTENVNKRKKKTLFILNIFIALSFHHFFFCGVHTCTKFVVHSHLHNNVNSVFINVKILTEFNKIKQI